MSCVFEPQAVTAARAILADEEPPYVVFLPDVRTDAHIWKDFASTMRSAMEELAPSKKTTELATNTRDYASISSTRLSWRRSLC